MGLCINVGFTNTRAVARMRESDVYVSDPRILCTFSDWLWELDGGRIFFVLFSTL